MSYTLYGSLTSPFVRRIRMVLGDLPYELREFNIFDPKDAELLNKINPVNQVPVLTDGEQAIWDSRQIFNYLNHRHRIQNMDWEDENLLTAMEGAMDSGIALLLMKRSNMDIEADHMFVQRQKDRIESVLSYLSPYMQGEGLKTWNFHSMTLYSFLDWAQFRQIVRLENRPEARAFLEAQAQRPIVTKTEIPKG